MPEMPFIFNILLSFLTILIAIIGWFVKKEIKCIEQLHKIVEKLDLKMNVFEAKGPFANKEYCTVQNEKANKTLNKIFDKIELCLTGIASLKARILK